MKDPNRYALRAAMMALAGLVLAVGYLMPLLPTPSRAKITVAVLLGACGALSIYRLWRMPQFALRQRLVLPVAAATLLVAFSVPLEKTAYPSLRVVATGQKSAMSGSSEVFVRLVSDKVRGLRKPKGEGWEERDEVFVSYRNQPQTLEYRGAWGQGATLRLVRHPFSGIAEVWIGDKVQTIDLFAAQQDYIDLPLPSPQTSWKSHLQRVAIGLASNLIFMAVCVGLAASAPAWASVFIAALLAGSGTLFFISDRSYPGPLELVSFRASAGPVRVEMNAGHGFTPALALSVKSGGVKSHSFAVSDPMRWRLQVDGAGLRPLNDMDGGSSAIPRKTAGNHGMDNGCPLAEHGRCLYEVRATGAFKAWLRAQDVAHQLDIPADGDPAARTFILVEREHGQIAATISQAYLQLSPWENFSGWIESIRVVGNNGKPAAKIFRLSSDSGDFREFRRGEGEGENLVPFMRQPATGSFAGMKFFAVLISMATVLMLAITWKTASALLDCYRSGHRASVLTSVAGCLLCLGLAAVAGWPAILGWDGLSPYIQAQAGQVTLWYGIGYPMLIGGFLQFGSGWLISVWSLLVTALLLLGAAALAIRYGSPLARWLVPMLMLLALPFTAVMVGAMTHLRDAMNGLLVALFALGIFSVALSWENWTGVQRRTVFFILLAAGAVLVLLRIDNLPALLIMLGGFIVHVAGLSRKSMALFVVASVFWLAVNPMMERIAILDRNGASVEKRLYASTAMINPLVGVLVHGGDRLTPELHAELSAVLDKVMDVEYATQHWSPYNVIYWHETSAKREMPSPEVIRQLRNIYVRAFLADPALFLRVRLVTFASTLGHDWFALPKLTQANHSGHPSFHDHLLATEGNWARLSQLQGFRENAHPSPQLARTLLNWSAHWASSAWALLVCVVVLARFRRHPLSAVLALAEVARTMVFFFFAPASVFLYLYDLHLLGFILPMLALAEQHLGQTRLRKPQQKELQ